MHSNFELAFNAAGPSMCQHINFCQIFHFCTERTNVFDLYKFTFLLGRWIFRQWCRLSGPFWKSLPQMKCIFNFLIDKMSGLNKWNGLTMTLFSWTETRLICLIFGTHLVFVPMFLERSCQIKNWQKCACVGAMAKISTTEGESLQKKTVAEAATASAAAFERYNKNVI